MTDLISEPDTGAIMRTASDELPPSEGDRPLAWAPAEPAPTKRRLGLWIGLGAAALVLAAAGASMILIAPGTTIAGVPVGGMTPGMAADAVSSRLASTQIELTGPGAGTVVSGGDLGAGVDATGLAEQAFAERPMWNLGAWMGDPITPEVHLDPQAADRTLRAAVPASYVDPVEATVSFDKASSSYKTTPAENGTGISVADLSTAFTAAAARSDEAFSFPGGPTPVIPDITDEKAAAAAEKLNGMLAKIGFYVGDERTVPVTPDVAASWLTIDTADGEVQITADQSAIQTMVATLPELVDREPVNASHLVNSKGEVLREVTEGLDGRRLGDTTGIASAFATDLGEGNAVFELPVTSTPFETTTVFRRLEVDISEQKTYLFENEKLVKTWKISSGLHGTDTPLGHFTVFAHTAKQNMGCFEGASYCTKDVPWNTWFAPNIAFHGAYWHNNFGHRMSHGCVNMPPSVAKQVYDMTPEGLEVWVHS
ncbi:L,D-transpeptidase [Microbacterium sp. ARD32]|uniref:L,D-transpeptidase n=1 Tax=Microbacterium sp. ARD32 TaxID=2962577 RepID=UPI00288287FC|nr:L,D-transpeptidase [Microbacterium sp. ARD32]MDT0156494.1 L,D-transpeptidase [Microbacterium sp. ARD32]